MTADLIPAPAGAQKMWSSSRLAELAGNLPNRAINAWIVARM
jgi:hypothetical protein